MDVILVNADLEEIDVIRWAEFQTDGFQCVRYFLSEHLPAVFHRANQVVYEEGLVVWFLDVLWCSRHYFLVYLESPPMQACGENLILGLAEMSFLGAIILQPEMATSICIKGVLIALLLAFVLFILGSVAQYKHLLSSARYYDKLSGKALDKMERGQQYTDEIPEDIKLDREQIKSSKVANILLFAAFCLILISTIALVPLIFKL